jgi:hypothetical protein
MNLRIVWKDLNSFRLFAFVPSAIWIRPIERNPRTAESETATAALFGGNQ